MLDIGNFYPEINTPSCVYARGLLQSASLTAPSRREPSVRFAFGYRDNVMGNRVRTFGERKAKKIPLRRKRLALLSPLPRCQKFDFARVVAFDVLSNTISAGRLLANLLRDDTLVCALGLEQ